MLAYPSREFGGQIEPNQWDGESGRNLGPPVHRMRTLHLISDMEKGRFTQKGGISQVGNLKEHKARWHLISACRLKKFSEPEGRPIRLTEDDDRPLIRL